MAQPQQMRLTEKQHKQLECWLWDADRTTLRYILKNICNMIPEAATLAYQQASCKDYVVADNKADISEIPARNGAAVAKQTSRPNASSSDFGNNGLRISYPEGHSERSEEERTLTTTPKGMIIPAMTAAGMSSSDVTSIPTRGNATASDRDGMSLASLLQPLSVPTTFNHQNNSTEAHTQPQSDSPVNKKRKLEHGPPRRLVICKKCGCPYDIHKDSNQLCIFHPGCMDRDEEAGEGIDDYGSISDRDHQVNEPELYRWSCCSKNGEELGCQQGRHRRNGARNIYAELKLRRGGDQNADAGSSDS